MTYAREMACRGVVAIWNTVHDNPTPQRITFLAWICKFLTRRNHKSTSFGSKGAVLVAMAEARGNRVASEFLKAVRGVN
jgi:hypothetical protein